MRCSDSAALLALAIALAVSASAGAETEPSERAAQQEADSADPDDRRLEPVVVEATRVEADLLDAPAAISVVERDAFGGERAGFALDEALARVPGVWAQNRYNLAQGLRLSVRGFGARAPFGVRGLAVVVDGVPATTLDGQSQLDGYDPGLIERMEVIRGPASALYGNAAGGVIRLTTLEPPDEPSAEAEISAGSFGQFIQRAHAGGNGERWRGAAHGSIVETGGHRDHAAAVHRRAGATIGRSIGASQEVGLLARVLHAPESLDPGGLTREQVRDDPRQANGFNALMDTGDDVSQQQAAVFWRAAPRTGERWEARAHLQRRDFEQRIPVPAPGPGWIELDRVLAGAGLQHSRNVAIAELHARLTAGFDLGWQRDDRQRFENLQGARGELRQDQLEGARAAGAYAQAELPLGDALWATAGARLDWLHLAVSDRLGEGDDDRSGARAFVEPSVLAGLTLRYAEAHAAYANVATAFESPTFVELRNPEGDGRGFNPELGAQDTVSLELGGKGVWAGGDARYDLAAFAAEVRGELIAYEKDGIDYYRNAGRTRRLGIEGAASYALGAGFETVAAATLGHFRFVDYVDDEGAQHGGRAIPGIPSAHGYLELGWRGRGFRIAGDVRAASRVFIDDANTDTSRGFASVGLRASRSVGGDGVAGRVFAAVDNLFDQAYAANVRINPAGDNPFEPAPGRTAYVGVALTWGATGSPASDADPDSDPDPDLDPDPDPDDPH